MVGIYFSGTGNSKYCLEIFLRKYGTGAKAVSIEDKGVLEEIRGNGPIAFSFPVQYSSAPKILKDFITANRELWKGREVFIIATMGLFSGDGAGVLARLLHKYGAVILGGLHVKMPDSISDEKALKRTLMENRRLLANAETKITEAARQLQLNHPPQEGLGLFYHLAGLFGQRLYFIHKTRHYTNQLKINREKCIGCGRCVALCPMGNLVATDKTPVAGRKCTMCYRCISQCPAQAITLLGRRVVEQCYLEKYLEKHSGNEGVF